MITHEELYNVKNDVNRALGAALFSMDYEVLQIILQASKSARKALKQEDYLQIQYVVNLAFWDIGIYIQEKIKRYSCIDSNFFEAISANIHEYFKEENMMGFTSENLKRCFKLVEMVDEVWFKKVAYNFPWSYFVELLDKVENFMELKTFFN